MLVLGMLAGGCGRSGTSEDGVSQLRQAFPDPAAVPAVQMALAAVQTNDLGQGVVALEAAKLQAGLTAEQLQSVEAAKQALTQELLNRADAGDAQAKAELELIERTRSQ
jgi:hypothetical protein